MNCGKAFRLPFRFQGQNKEIAFAPTLLDGWMSKRLYAGVVSLGQTRLVSRQSRLLLYEVDGTDALRNRDVEGVPRAARVLKNFPNSL
jgi:hypothetical protein